MVEKIVYGVRPLKKGERYANMQEAAQKGQIRYWGLYKVDNIMRNITINKGKKKKNTKIKPEVKEIEAPKKKYTKRQAEIAMAAMHSHAEKLRNIISGHRKEEDKINAQVELKKLQDKFDIVKDIYDRLKDNKKSKSKK